MGISDVDKLRILMPHWIEHNHSHEAEYHKWAAIAREQGQVEVSELISKAISSMKEADKAIEQALQKIGGPSGANEQSHDH